ncbi:Procathepsin L [Manis pentadactyla]|nr:Procathepsin L [Manis pentadactyla]
MELRKEIAHTISCAPKDLRIEYETKRASPLLLTPLEAKHTLSYLPSNCNCDVTWAHVTKPCPLGAPGPPKETSQKVKGHGGISSTWDQPLTVADGGHQVHHHEDTDACNCKPEFATANDTGFVGVPRWEKALMKAMATVSPISVAIDAGHESFQFYKAGQVTVTCQLEFLNPSWNFTLPGIYDPQCSSKDLDHGILLVGYGFEGTDSNNRF